MRNKEQCRRTPCKGFVIMIISLALLSSSCSRRPAYQEPARTAEGIEISVKSLKPGIPQFLTYHSRNKGVNFFVVKVQDRVVSFFDACAKCYPWKLGYRFDNGYVVCKKCNVRYDVPEIEKGVGSCFPVQIQGQLQGDKYIIPFAVLDKGAHMF